MKLHLTTSENKNLITGYGSQYIAINQQQYLNNVIVLPDQIISPWFTGDVSQLKGSDLTCFLSLQPEVLLMGTGEKHHFIHPKNYHALTDAGIAVECMATAAACRTYNILVSENRRVAAALICH